MTSKKYVLIYKDRGVGPLSFKETLLSLRACLPSTYQVNSVNAAAVIQGDVFDDAALFVLPGGRDVPYHEDLAGAGNNNLRHFVNSGGGFLGICAGAYFGAGEVLFENGHPLEVKGTRELAFFPGLAEGPVYGLGRYRYDSEESGKAALVNIQGQTLHIYYNGGCSFRDVHLFEPSINVLGSYQDAGDKPLAAIIQCQVGKGTVILSGVHLDYRPQCVKNQVPDELVELLEKSDASRIKLLTELLSKVLA
ncbi:MAG: BPL-N domain-containing protein [Chlamydiales bacterium]|nr:BPL-N domain-containing protein [Chlamydiales bacterium]